MQKYHSILIKPFICLGAFCAWAIMAPLANATVVLSIQNGNSSSLVATPGETFTLNLNLADTVGGQKLDSFDLQLSGQSGSVAPLPTGITLQSYNDTLSNWFTAPNTSNLSYTAFANSTSFDVTLAQTATTLGTATFSLAPTISAGTYTLRYSPMGSSFQDLYDPLGNAISYTENDLTIQVVPEPSTGCLLIIGTIVFCCLLGTRALQKKRG